MAAPNDIELANGVRPPPFAAPFCSPIWWISKDGDPVCKKLYDRHYSSRKYKDGREPKLFCGPGEKLVLRTWEGDALWVWRRFHDDSGQEGVNCAVFRNESRYRSSQLVRQADAIADLCWPGVRHYTFVHPGRIRSTNPGCCFKAAGWRACGRTKGGLVILERDWHLCDRCGWPHLTADACASSANDKSSHCAGGKEQNDNSK